MLRLLPNFQKGVLDRTSVLKSQDLRGWLLGKRGVVFFNGTCSFYIKRVYKKLFLSVISENLNWENLTKNLATFKDRMGLRMKNFNIMRVH